MSLMTSQGKSDFLPGQRVPYTFVPIVTVLKDFASFNFPWEFSLCSENANKTKHTTYSNHLKVYLGLLIMPKEQKPTKQTKPNQQVTTHYSNDPFGFLIRPRVWKLETLKMVFSTVVFKDQL